LALVIFEIGSHFIRGTTWTTIFLLLLPCVAGMIGICHHTLPLIEMGSCELLAQGWP
jgi:hypothetical protein